MSKPMTRPIVAAALGCAFFAVPTLGWAADAVATQVVIPWGDMLGATLAWARDLFVMGASAIAAAFLPAAARQYLTNELLGKAVDYAIGVTAGAIHGKTVDLPTSNALIEAAVQYAVQNGPKIAAQAGDTLRAKIIARLSAAGVLPPEHSA